MTEKKRYLNNRREIILTASLFAALFLGMAGYLAYFTATSQQEMINNSYNSRQEILLSRNYRGAIYANDGVILAETLLDSEQKETRVYPFNNLFSHIVGYSTNGRMGVEALANYYLINTSTSLTNKVANDMAGLKNPGDNVYTTLDVELQQVANSQLGIYRGAVVVTEVSTGKILALVSHPDFDPNKISDIWDSLVKDSSSSVLLNRATQGLYPPGSTFKIITALEYIRENPQTYQDYTFQCPGYFISDGNRVNCYHGNVHGRVNLEKSLVKSCNSSFANLGLGLDWDSFDKTLESLLFNSSLPLTLSYSRSSINTGEMPIDEKMQTTFGQGKTLMTPMHLNMITAAIANGGVMMKPYVVDRVVNDEGSLVKAFKPGAYGRVLSEEESAVMVEMMTAVVQGGGAGQLANQEYTVAGKTGSAEYNDIKGECHAWFTGFAPAENPEICVTVIMEGAGGGGEYAVPVARRIFDAYFREK